MANKYKILIIDDEVDFRQLLQNGLGKKYDITSTDSGKKAFDLLKDYQPDLIITDIVMPGISGLSFLSSVEKRNIPTIVMSGLALDALETAKEFIADDTIAKPFRIADLEKKIEHILGQTKILIDIESDIERKALHRILVEGKHKVYSAFGEKHLLDMVAKRRIDLIIKEVKGLDNKALIKKIRAVSLTRDIPIIGVSLDAELKTKGPQDGLSAILLKPVGRDDLMAAVVSLMPKAKSGP